MDFSFIDDKMRLDALFELYLPLLTEKQSDALHLHLLSDYSETEIANHLGVTRQAVHDMIKRSILLLEDLEEKLGFLEKSIKYDELISGLRTIAAQDTKSEIQKKLMELIQEYDI